MGATKDSTPSSQSPSCQFLAIESSVLSECSIFWLSAYAHVHQQIRIAYIDLPVNDSLFCNFHFYTLLDTVLH